MDCSKNAEEMKKWEMGSRLDSVPVMLCPSGFLQRIFHRGENV